MFENIDSTTLTVVSSVVALAWGFFYMRSRLDQAKEKFEIERHAAGTLKRVAQKKEIESELQEIEKELTTEIPKALRPGADVLPFRKDEKKSLVSLEEALKSTRSGLMGRIRGLLKNEAGVTSEDLEAIEEVLYTSDLGPLTVQRLIQTVTEKMKSSKETSVETLRLALKEEMFEILESAKTDKEISRFFEAGKSPEHKPEVWMIVGVNGAGKTTTIGKLAHKLATSGKSVLVAAGDTFRAAAGEQLKIWTERAQVEIYAPEGVESPSAVAFDACKVAQQKGFDHLIVDTAGRLHTQKNLMDELKKVKRVIDKSQTGAPHEVLLVLDANSGQNALIQAREFHAAIGVTGVVLTKLDGTAKGGMAVGVAAELGLPIQLIGVGEGKEDIRPFSARAFVDAIV